MTKKYILMCEKAGEIQELWRPKEGDCSIFYNDGITPRFKRIISCLWREVNKKKYVWLPRQDQLQKILTESSNWRAQAHLVLDFICTWKKTTKAWEKFETMEQLWLGYLMYERYNKIWDRTDWVKNG